jgi:hypothetical protein
MKPKSKAQSLSRRLLALSLTWLALTVVFFGIGLVCFNPRPDYRLAKSNLPTEGRVTALEPDNHQIVRYTYRVGPQEYAGSGHGGQGNPAFKDITVGQSVIVYYDPTRPTVSTLGSPASPLFGNVLGVIFVTLLPPIFVIWTLYRMGYFR